MENTTAGAEAPAEESYLDRLKKYRKLMAGGMGDKEASEAVWPTVGIITKKPSAESK